MPPLIIVPKPQELYRACNILFGMEVQATPSFLEYIQISGIKSAFRKKAFETHPDLVLAGSLGLGSDTSPQTFLEIKAAYDLLTTYLHAREKGYRLPGNSPRQGNCNPAPAVSRPMRAGSIHPAATVFNFNSAQTTGPALNTKELYTGTMPSYPLLFGRYLYYSGIISWFNISQAVVWQRTKRPLVGEIGRQMGWLSLMDTLTILRNGKKPTPFGEAALGLGLLSEVQINTILAHQKRLQKKIGQFFVDQKIITAEELQYLITQHRLHNTRHGNSQKTDRRF